MGEIIFPMFLKEFFVKILLALFLVFSLTACDKPCDLSPLKIKSVKIEGDTGEFVARAVKAELYKYGVQTGEGGVDLVGSMKLMRGSDIPYELSIEAISSSFSSTARASGLSPDKVIASQRIAEGVASDFCSSAPPVKK